MVRLALVLATALLSACAHAMPEVTTTPPPDAAAPLSKRSSTGHGLQPFGSIEELRQHMTSVVIARRLAEEDSRALSDLCAEQVRLHVARDRRCPSSTLQEYSLLAPPTHSITNNQHAGVDEGDIVKRHGDVLIVLRRGRLFTIGIGGGQLDSLSIADAFGPSADDIDPTETWYDELIVWQHKVIVVGYSYQRGGTEIGLFDLGDHGELQYRETYHLRSDDYYSSSNYATRLIGHSLVLFTSVALPENVDPNGWLPALRRWGPRGSNGTFETIAPINRVFQPAVPLSRNPAIHSLVVCNLATPSLECDATVVLGNYLSAYYASPTAAYAWTTAWTEEGLSRAVLYRIPFDGTPVSAIGVKGEPPNQLAFLEDEDEYLNVVVAEQDHQYVLATLLRLPLYMFSDGSLDAPDSYYRPIARGERVMARFVGRYLLVATPTYAERRSARRVFVTTPEGSSTVRLGLPYAVQRLEAMGAHAVAVGTDTDENLFMSAIWLGSRPAIANTFSLKDASQSEDRSHAFFYRQDSENDGVFGFPIVTMLGGDDVDRWKWPTRVLFIRNRGLLFSLAGTLDPPTTGRVEDHCLASCIDWYGEARPIFIDDRIFALSGYNLIEGRLTNGRVQTVGHLDFTPITVETAGHSIK